MALKVTKANEVIEVKTLCFTIYSQPGLGKTSMAFTAANPLLLDFDRGSHRAVDRKDVVQVDAWSDIAGMTADDVAEYDTIIIDTVGKALDSLAADIIAKNSRLAFGGALNQQGWGQLGVRFSAFLKMLRSYGKDVVLIAHMEEKQEGDVIKERLKIQGGSKDLVLTDSDVIARISIYNKERVLMFSPTEASFGKDPAGIVQAEIPDASSEAFATYLQDTLAAIKSAMNELSEAQIERKSEVEWFTKALPDLTTPEEVNNLLGRAKKAGRDVAKMLVERAREMQLEYDSETAAYVYLEEVDTEEEAGPDEGDQISADAA